MLIIYVNHVSASCSLCREMTRTRARWSGQRRGSKSRSSLQRAEMIYYVTLSPRGSWTQSWHCDTGSKLIGHLRSPEVTPVRRACAYVERRSELLDVAYCRANFRHEPLTFWHEPLTFDFLDRSTFWTAFFRTLKTFRLTFLRMRNKCKITNIQRNNKAFSV